MWINDLRDFSVDMKTLAAYPDAVSPNMLSMPDWMATGGGMETGPNAGAFPDVDEFTGGIVSVFAVTIGSDFLGRNNEQAYF